MKHILVFCDSLFFIPYVFEVYLCSYIQKWFYLLSSFLVCAYFTVYRRGGRFRLLEAIHKAHPCTVSRSAFVHVPLGLGTQREFYGSKHGPLHFAKGCHDVSQSGFVKIYIHCHPRCWNFHSPRQHVRFTFAIWGCEMSHLGFNSLCTFPHVYLCSGLLSAVFPVHTLLTFLLGCVLIVASSSLSLFYFFLLCI